MRGFFHSELTNFRIAIITVIDILSGREDLNLRLLAPHASALAGLRYAPIV
jgi:hypothetical protein